MAGAVDLFVAIKFVRLLSTPWVEWEAFNLGLIDETGKRLKKAKTKEEKESMTIFHVMVKNVKRIMEKLPFGKTKLASYATALFLIKEEYGEEQYKKIEKEFINYLKKEQNINEEIKQSQKNIIYTLSPGKYIIEQGIYEGSFIILTKMTKSIDHIVNTPIFKSKNIITNKMIYFTAEELKLPSKNK